MLEHPAVGLHIDDHDVQRLHAQDTYTRSVKEPDRAWQKPTLILPEASARNRAIPNLSVLVLLLLHAPRVDAPPAILWGLTEVLTAQPYKLHVEDAKEGMGGKRREWIEPIP